MPSRQVYEEFAADGLIDTSERFNKCGRETPEDLDLLYEVLASFKDGTGRPPVLTTNFVMANPDFEAIEACGYGDYSWIPIDDVNNRPSQDALLVKYREGVGRGLICPQYHGRDHFSAESWLRALRDGDCVALAGLRRGVPLPRSSRFLENEYVENWDGIIRPLSQAVIDAKTKTGISIFERAFGVRSLTSIAPAYLWSDTVETCLRRQGVRCMQAASHRLLPCDEGGRLERRVGILGERATSGMMYLVRNCQFEPSRDGRTAPGRCLDDIAIAFSRGYPALVDTHRVNYVGVVDPAMRDASLTSLRELLQGIVSGFPGVRFATSAELAAALLRSRAESGRVGQSDLCVRRASVFRRAIWAARERRQWWRMRR